MESLCYSVNKESEVAYDVSTSLTHLSAHTALTHHVALCGHDPDGNVSGVDRRETGLFFCEKDVTVWDPGL